MAAATHNFASAELMVERCRVIKLGAEIPAIEDRLQTVAKIHGPISDTRDFKIAAMTRVPQLCKKPHKCQKRRRAIDDEIIYSILANDGYANAGRDIPFLVQRATASKNKAAVARYPPAGGDRVKGNAELKASERYAMVLLGAVSLVWAAWCG